MKKTGSFNLSRILAQQVGLLGVLAIVLWALHYQNSAYSVMLGGGICMVSTAYFTVRAFSKRYPAVQARSILHTLYKAELQKLVINGVLFFISFKWLLVSPLLCLIGWIIAQALFLKGLSHHHSSC